MPVPEEPFFVRDRSFTNMYGLQLYLFNSYPSLLSINLLSVIKEYGVNECLLNTEFGKRLPRDIIPVADMGAPS